MLKSTLIIQVTQESIVQGNSEERIETYKKYDETVPELSTQQYASSSRRVGSSADKSAAMVRGLYV